MIEGYDTDGRAILINRAEVVEVYADNVGDDYSAWCNVKTTSGHIHRFRGTQATKVYNALRGER